MTSAIDASKPAVGSAFTADLRANLATAAAEISALQAINATLPQNLFSNLSLGRSISGGALTLSIKTAAGLNPSAASPVPIAFRNVDSSIGDYTIVPVVAANSLTISSGSTLGTFVAPTSFRIWIVAFNDGGTVRLGVINCLLDIQDFEIYKLKGLGIASSTAEGGAGAADLAWTFYTGVAVTSKPYTILGYVTYEGSLTVPGTWDILPSVVQVFGPGVPLPGDVVQVSSVTSGNMVAITGLIPYDDTIPQDTEGSAPGFGVPLVPSSAANIAEIFCRLHVANSLADNPVIGAVFGGSSSALATDIGSSSVANRPFTLSISEMAVCRQTTNINFIVRAGAVSASTTTFNGASAARLLGGSYNSHLVVREIMV